MELIGEEVIAQPKQRVWDCLNDPEILKACLAGCDEIIKTGDNDYKVVLNAAIGPVKARFTGKLMLSNLDPPNAYSMAFEGAGGAAGFAKGAANVQLTAVGESTKLAYQANAKIGGKIAQVGSRLIDGVARKIAADFFARFNELVTTPGSIEAPNAELTRGAAATAAGSRWTQSIVWGALAVAVAIALYFFLGR